MKILVTGSSGLIGSELVPYLAERGHGVMRLLRTTPRPGQTAVYWDPAAQVIKQDYLEGFDAVVHLAGESIAAGRWTRAKKERIRQSRVEATRFLCETLARVQQPPKVLLSASAIGFYGDRGDELLRENSSPGAGFLAEVCQAWESATRPVLSRGVRVVHLRWGIVLSPKGGALAKMLLPFKMGVGGVIGSGQQYMSWIALDDAVGAILHALRTDSLRGPVNGVAPSPVINRDYTQTLGRVLGRSTFFPMPAFAARLAFGEMADALLLSSARVDPTQLSQSGYKFLYPTLEGALRHLLQPPN